MATITVDLVAKTGSFQTDVKRASREMQRARQEMEADIKKIGTAFGALGAGAVIGLGALVRQSVNTGDAINDMAQRVGVSVQALSRLQVAAKLSDTSLQTLQTGFGKLAKAQTDAARGNKEQIDLFKAMGVQFQNVDGTLRDTEQVFLDVADVFKELPDGAEKTALALKLLGRGGQELIPVMNGGREAMERTNQIADELGITLTQETAAGAAQLNDTLDLLQLSVQGIGNRVTADLLPQLNEFAEVINSPAFRDGFAAMAQGAVTATTKTIELLGFLGQLTTFAGEEAAARINGPDPNDIIRLEQAVERQQALMDQLDQVGTGAEFPNSSGYANEQRAELIRLKASLLEASKAQEDLAVAQYKAGLSAASEAADINNLKVETRATSDSLRDYFKDQNAAAEAAKLAAIAERDSAKADREREKALRDKADAEQWYAEMTAESAKQEREWNAERQRVTDEFNRSLQDIRDETALLGLSGNAREQAIILLQAERMARQLNTGSIAEATIAYQKELQALAAAGKAEANAREYERIWESAAQSMGEYLVSGAENGLDGVMDLMEGFARELQSFWVKNAITIPLQQQMQGGGGGMAAFGQSLNTNSMYGQGGTGSTAGGWMSAAGSAFGGWEAAQEGNALGTVAGFTAAGAQIGGVYGAIIGAIVGVLVAVFKDVAPPDLRIGAEGYTRKPEQSFDTVFGTMQVGVRGGVDEHPFIDAVTQFDEAIAGVIRTFQDGDAQFEEVRERLSTWSLDLRGMDNITGEAVLEARFDAILGTFDQAIQQYVRTGEDLEAQVQLLSDAAFIEAAAIQGDLLPAFEDLAAILEANRAEGEAITAVYERLRGAAVTLTAAMNYSGVEIERVGADFIQFATDAATAAGGLDRFRALVGNYFDTFYTEAERNVRNLDIARVTGAGEFADIDLNLADYTDEGGATAFRTAFESIMGSLSAEALVEWYEAAEALGIVLDLQQRVNGATEDAAAALEAAAEAERARIEAAFAYADTVLGINAQLYELSGATDFRRSLSEINAQYLANVDALTQQAVAAGLAGARTEDLTSAMQLQARQTAALIRDLEQAAVAQADAMGLTPLAMINAEIAALQETEQAAATEAQRLGDSIRRMGEISGDVASAMLGEFGPLSGTAKADYALRALQDGAIGLDAALQAGRDVFASGQDFNRFFNQAVAIAQNRPDDTAQGIGQSVSFAMRELLQQQAELQEEANRASTLLNAQSLAQTIADLSSARGQDFQTVIDALGIDADGLFAALGLDDIGFGELITQLQSEQDSIATWYANNVTADGRYIVDAMHAIFAAGQDPLLNPIPVPDYESPIGKDPPLLDGEKSGRDERDEQMAMLLERVDRLTSVVERNLPNVAKSTDRVAVASKDRLQIAQRGSMRSDQGRGRAVRRTETVS